MERERPKPAMLKCELHFHQEAPSRLGLTEQSEAFTHFKVSLVPTGDASATSVPPCEHRRRNGRRIHHRIAAIQELPQKVKCRCRLREIKRPRISIRTRRELYA